ncbi:MAG: sigma-70 family RNA polymerase sigma factor [Candidatus Sumerlaeota bacterium]|nr:sigma-70 family RNA polymerase sigma factor [Candidatus Sumerlaeota bacterium]
MNISLLSSVLSNARARRPHVAFDPGAVAAALARHYPRGDPPAQFAAEDFALAAAVCAGDSQAWAAFYNEFRGFIVRVARRFARNEADAEEIAQDFSGEEAVRRLALYSGRCSLQGWLAAVVPNIVRDWYRRRAREVMPDSQAPAGAESEGRRMDDAPGLTREEALAAVEDRLDRPPCETVLRESLRSGWSLLKAEDREILEFKFLHGLRNREIMAALRAREDVVSKRLKKAVERLGKLLRRYALTRFEYDAQAVRDCVELLVGKAGVEGLWSEMA